MGSKNYEKRQSSEILESKILTSPYKRAPVRIAHDWGILLDQEKHDGIKSSGGVRTGAGYSSATGCTRPDSSAVALLTGRHVHR